MTVSESGRLFMFPCRAEFESIDEIEVTGISGLFESYWYAVSNKISF